MKEIVSNHAVLAPPSVTLDAASTGLQVRQAARSGHLSHHTSGLAMDYVQGNLVLLPEPEAASFLRFCHRNPGPCPVLAVAEPGSFRLPELAHDLDIRTDLPRYRIWREGQLHDEPSDLLQHWAADLVSIVIGCSFSFEHALVSAGISLRHVAEGKNVAMYNTTISTQPSGRFAGPMVVSMRPMRAADAIRAVQITSRLPQAHGAPVHIGNPALIGIADLARPDYGDAIEVREDEVPVFWACGVTPQAVIAAARLPFYITHAPGAMLVTDQLNSRMGA